MESTSEAAREGAGNTSTLSIPIHRYGGPAENSSGEVTELAGSEDYTCIEDEWTVVSKQHQPFFRRASIPTTSIEQSDQSTNPQNSNKNPLTFAGSQTDTISLSPLPPTSSRFETCVIEAYHVLIHHRDQAASSCALLDDDMPIQPDGRGRNESRGGLPYRIKVKAKRPRRTARVIAGDNATTTASSKGHFSQSAGIDAIQAQQITAEHSSQIGEVLHDL